VIDSQVIAFAGAAALLTMAPGPLQSLWRATRGHGTDASVGIPTMADDGRRQSRRSFVEGLLSNLLNPKTAVFYLAFLPQFVGPSDDVLSKSLLLAGIHYVEAVVWLVTLSVLFDRMQRFILKSTVRRWLDGACGVALMGFGARVAFERR
jgi:threonine/homoserine/homoserine lactone efflux protein